MCHVCGLVLAHLKKALFDVLAEIVFGFIRPHAFEFGFIEELQAFYQIQNKEPYLGDSDSDEEEYEITQSLCFQHISTCTFFHLHRKTSWPHHFSFWPSHCSHVHASHTITHFTHFTEERKASCLVCGQVAIGRIASTDVPYGFVNLCISCWDDPCSITWLSQFNPHVMEFPNKHCEERFDGDEPQGCQAAYYRRRPCTCYLSQ
jgi:hypothetical protein